MQVQAYLTGRCQIFCEIALRMGFQDASVVAEARQVRRGLLCGEAAGDDLRVEADAVAIADVWAGRDPDTSIASASGLAEATRRRRPGLTVAAPGSVEDTAAWLGGEVKAGDVVLVMGGGRSYRIGELLLAELEQR